MNCPSCGYPIDQQTMDRCPRCGYILTATTESHGQDASPPSGISAPSQGGDPGATGGYAPPQQSPQPPQYYPYPPAYSSPGEGAPSTPGQEPAAGPGMPPQYPYGQYGQYAPPSGYGQPPQGPYGQPAPPSGYGQPAPPSGYGQPYGAYAPPSYPLAPGYPQQWPQIAPLPERKSRTGLIVGIVALIVVVLAACTGGAVWAVQSLAQRGAPTLAGTPAPSATATISATKVYSNILTSNADGWALIPDHCYLGSDGYHAAGGYYCTVPIVEQDNVDISVKAQQVSGPTTWPYGIMFRQQDKDNFYAFMIVGVGDWVFLKCVNADCTTPVYFTANDAIKSGLGVTNTIETRATGSHFVFFVNGVNVGNFDDTAFTLGKVGFFASGKTIDCAFTDLVITRPE